MYIKGHAILDDEGRTLLLRGVNLGGSSKIPLINPLPECAGEEPGGGLSFVGRPFPLEEAETHFERLKSWGFTFIRLVLTWESLEHEGPGIYDESYLAYLRKLLMAAEKAGISVYMDPHQDVWSRFSGGDGAPGWTMEKLGMDLSRLDETGAALTMEGYGGLHGGKPYPPMIWPSNYSRYGAATLFTLFFGGRTYAPGCEIEGINAQDWLQEHYLACMRHCYRRLKNCGAIIGWGAINEPHPGYIGYQNLERLENYILPLGPLLLPLDAMAAASGYTVTAPVYKPGVSGPRVVEREIINSRRVSLFREGFGCPWKHAGVWSDGGGRPELLKPRHFALYEGRPVNFTEDFLKPFMIRFVERMREADRPCIFFIEGIPGGLSQGSHPAWNKDDPPDAVNAFHHYDGPTLFIKAFLPWLTADPATGQVILGRKKTAAFYSRCLAQAGDWTRERMGNMPRMLGEFGLPMDLYRGRAYRQKGGNPYGKHEEALDLYYRGIEDNLLHATIWNYTADNTHEKGDHWNGEDLSIVSLGWSSPRGAVEMGPEAPESAAAKPLAEPRAMRGWLRPYPMATAGAPLLLRWDYRKRQFRYRFRADSSIPAPTEIFAPPECFGANPRLRLSVEGPGGEKLRAEYRKEERRIFIYNGGYEGDAELNASPGAKEG
jgi:hypothetical protein